MGSKWLKIAGCLIKSEGSWKRVKMWDVIMSILVIKNCKKFAQVSGDTSGQFMAVRLRIVLIVFTKIFFNFFKWCLKNILLF